MLCYNIYDVAYTRILLEASKNTTFKTHFVVVVFFALHSMLSINHSDYLTTERSRQKAKNSRSSVNISYPKAADTPSHALVAKFSLIIVG